MFLRVAPLVLLLTPADAWAYGEGVDPSRPDAVERALHLQTDLLRVDPDSTDPQWSTLSPVRPLIWNEELYEASSFYARDIAEHGCFPADHSSCDGTAFDARLSSFYSGSLYGENIAQGYADAEAAVWEGWLYSDGHRANMLSAQWNEVGVAMAVGIGGATWVQDFGTRSGLVEPIVTSASSVPLSADLGDSVTLLAAVYDPSGPLAWIELAIGGECKAMALYRGEAARGVFQADFVAGDRVCEPWFLRATRASGDAVDYPSTGALLLPVGGAECEAWTPERPEAPCGGPPELGNPSGLEGVGTGCASDGAEADGPNANTTGNVEYGSCAVAASRRPVPAGWAVSLLGVFLRRSGRRARPVRINSG